MFHNNLTNTLKNYLREIGVSDDSINAHFVTLTQPTSKSLIYIEQQELLTIGKAIEKDAGLVELFKTKDVKGVIEDLPKDILDMLERHRAKYYYSKCIFVHGEYVLEDYIKQLQDIFSGDTIPSEILENQDRELQENKEKKEQLCKELNLDEKWKNIFVEFGEFMVTKIYRRYAQIFALYNMGNILREIAKRFYLTEKQVRHMLPHEVEDMLLRDTYDEGELSQRSKMCVYYAQEGVDKIYTGKEADKIMKQTEVEIDTDIDTLAGEIGCPGSGRGKVRIIIRSEDMKKMKDGDVLVSIATDPDIVPAMKRASAIVTEQGGVTSHAAIVSRELGIPCVIGTKIATKVLKDGDIVEVDANKGVVTILK
ncbi:hypothetical protein C0581_00865 [Candidatus Parcubacteria bacterium]|nr:MAG: hypothetical protein C0581_00865 [Candidatus Parcubacteria bacterium]